MKNPIIEFQNVKIGRTYKGFGHFIEISKQYINPKSQIVPSGNDNLCWRFIDLT
jgi:hypothetical protein